MNDSRFAVIPSAIPDLAGSGYACDFNTSLLTDPNNTMSFYGSVMLGAATSCSCCPEGSYCPVTYSSPVPGVSVLPCPKGHFCPVGTADPVKCYFLQICDKEGLVVPEKQPTVMACLSILLLTFGVIPIFVQYIRLFQRNSQHRKKAAGRAEVAAKKLERLEEEKKHEVRKETAMQMWSDHMRNTECGEEKPDHHLIYPTVTAHIKMMLVLAAHRAQKMVRKRARITAVYMGEVKKDPVVLTFRDVCVFKASTSTALTKDGPMRVENKVFYLNNATGFIRPGKVTALMGPSGCGKSTLISALSNRVAEDMYSGSIYLNGKSVRPNHVNNICGFVPQEDIMNADLSVKENLGYICRLRHDPKSPLKDRKKQAILVNAVINAMGLYKVRHSIIGGGAKRGISGGQKKRVNIAMELMHDPRVIFMDEPTSGLDASMSCEFLDYMRHIAVATGVSVVMVIHQPNPDTFGKVDDVILMQPSPMGGRIAYCGPASRGTKYFSSLVRRPIHEWENPADRYIEILSAGKPQKSPGTGDPVPDDDGTLLADFYEEFLLDSGEVWNGVPGVSAPPLQDVVPSLDIDREFKRNAPSFFTVAVTAGTMFLNMQMNNITGIITNDFAISMLCCVLSLMNMNINQLLFVANLLFGLVSGLYGASIFKDHALLNRYKSSGLNTIALFFGVVIASIPRILIQNVAFNVPFYNINCPMIRGINLFQLTLVGQLTAYMIGMTFCVMFPSGGADVNTVMGTLILWVFSGLNPKASELDDSTPGKVGMYFSFTRWMLGSELILAADRQSMCSGTFNALALEELGILPEDATTTTKIAQVITLNDTQTNTLSQFDVGRVFPIYEDGQDDFRFSLMLALFLLLFYMLVAGAGFWQGTFFKSMLMDFQDFLSYLLEVVNYNMAQCVGLTNGLRRDTFTRRGDGDDDDDDDDEDDDHVLVGKDKGGEGYEGYLGKGVDTRASQVKRRRSTTMKEGTSRQSQGAGRRSSAVKAASNTDDATDAARSSALASLENDPRSSDAIPRPGASGSIHHSHQQRRTSSNTLNADATTNALHEL
jgi:ABC-type multidrug transport system ATPase subunit